MSQSKPPVVLCFSGLDPTGGAGIQADIEAIAQHACHTAPIITALTVQNTHDVFGFEPVDADVILKQARTILNDMPISAIKIGMLGSAETAEAIYTLLRKHPEIPVIFDPVISAGGGSPLSQKNLLETIGSLILPCTYILTPNIPEALKLTHAKIKPDTAALMLNKKGAKHVLLTGTHSDTPNITHKLFYHAKEQTSFHYKRLQHKYHGSGCTLASSLAALIAQEMDLINACQNALDYTYKTLKNANQLGGGQLIPKRNLC